MRSEISKLHKRLNATTIYVTHDQTEAMTMGDRIVILNKGIIQQVDTPLAIYTKPNNLFVAGFVGQMNFLKGDLQGQTLHISSTHKLVLPESLLNSCKSYQGKSMILGLRPEHFEAAQAASSEKIQISITPELVETLGSEKMVHFSLDGQAAVAKIDPLIETPLGHPLKLVIDVSRASLFDPETEQRIG
jgi:multiple sugar transport system ATP-binding protein